MIYVKQVKLNARAVPTGHNPHVSGKMPHTPRSCRR